MISVQQFAEHFEGVARDIYLNMIPEYQEGYITYVYQTDNPSVQQRRFKNLAKSFRRLLEQPYFYIQKLAQTRACEIAETWTYPESYQWQLVTSQKAQLLGDEERTATYFEVIHNGAFIGFFSKSGGENQMLDFALKPNLLGTGLGKGFYQAIEDYLKANGAPKTLTVKLASINQPAYDFCLTCGYKPVKSKETKQLSSAILLRKSLKA